MSKLVNHSIISRSEHIPLQGSVSKGLNKILSTFFRTIYLFLSCQYKAEFSPLKNPPSKAGRGVPDVAGNADPASGYSVRVDGQDFVIGGTSAVAPLWAGLIVLLNQKLAKPVGFLNPLIYGKFVGTGSLKDIVSGSNGAYVATKGWDACTRYGSPDGKDVLYFLNMI